jgi:hypothetical protein
MSAHAIDVLQSPDLLDLFADEPELLAVADAIALTQQHPRRIRLRGRSTLLVAAVTAVMVMVGAAIAGNWGPLAGLTAVDHSATPADTLGAAVRSQLKNDEAPSGSAIDQVGTRLSDSARLVGVLPSRQKVYALASSKGKLCVAVAGLAESCGPALSLAAPITFTIVDRDGPGGAPPTAYGVAIDKVASVSFRVAGVAVTVPVHDNFFAYQGSSLDTGSDFSAATVTFTDGSSEPAR